MLFDCNNGFVCIREQMFLEEKRKNLSRDELKTVAVFVPSLALELILEGNDYRPFYFDLHHTVIMLADLSGERGGVRFLFGLSGNKGTDVFGWMDR